MIAEILTLVSFLTSAATLITFVKSSRKESEARGARQAMLDHMIGEIKESVERMSKLIAAQQDDINRLKLWMELLLQQHQQNHGQDIRRS